MSSVASSLRVVSLQAHNILRLSAVDVGWDADKAVLTVGGRNGAGKSSVLNAVAMALGGAALCPEEPVRRGETEGFVEVNLGELVVRREFSREKILVSSSDETWGETKSKIVVRNAEGVRLGTPQAVLDKLIGKLTFDPLAFAAMGSEGSDGRKRQAEILRKIVGLDLTDLEAKRKSAFERRASFNKDYKDGTARLTAMATYKDAPAEETPISDISNEMLKAEEYRRLALEAEREVGIGKVRLASRETQCQVRRAKIEELQKQLTDLKEELEGLEKTVEDEMYSLDALIVTADAAKAVVPDMEAIRRKLTEVEASNVKVRANKAHEEAAKRVAEMGLKAKAEDDAIARLDREKEDALKALKFPVDGLGVGDDGITFNGLPFSQASTSEQIRVSVAVGFALNPSLKLLLVRNGNALDEDALKMVAAQTEAAGGQILMEFVTKDASAVSVMIEDGHLA